MSDAPPAGRPGPADHLQNHRAALLKYIDDHIGPKVRRLSSPDDIYQEVFLRANGRLPADLRDPLAWLCYLAKQCIADAADLVNAQKRDPDREVPGNVRIGDGSQDLIALLAGDSSTPSSKAGRNERLARIWAAVATFTEEEQEVLRLSYLEGLSPKAVADRLGKSTAATRMHLTDLLERVRHLIGVG